MKTEELCRTAESCSFFSLSLSLSLEHYCSCCCQYYSTTSTVDITTFKTFRTFKKITLYGTTITSIYYLSSTQLTSTIAAAAAAAADITSENEIEGEESQGKEI